MTASKHSPHSLRHQFLVASPYLQDPRFHGAVIYLCEHSDEGALGLTVNLPLEILEQLDMEGGELDVPVYGGGPVQPERGFVLHSPDAGWQNTAQVADDVLLTTSRDVLSDIGAGRGPKNYLVCLGYATADILFRTPWEDRYQAVLKLIGIDLNQLSEFVGHA